MKVLVSATTLFLLANSPAFCADIDGVRYDALPEPSYPLLTTRLLPRFYAFFAIKLITVSFAKLFR